MQHRDDVLSGCLGAGLAPGLGASPLMAAVSHLWLLTLIPSLLLKLVPPGFLLLQHPQS